MQESLRDFLRRIAIDNYPPDVWEEAISKLGSEKASFWIAVHKLQPEDCERVKKLIEDRRCICLSLDMALASIELEQWAWETLTGAPPATSIMDVLIPQAMLEDGPRMRLLERRLRLFDSVWATIRLPVSWRNEVRVIRGDSVFICSCAWIFGHSEQGSGINEGFKWFLVLHDAWLAGQSGIEYTDEHGESYTLRLKDDFDTRSWNVEVFRHRDSRTFEGTSFSKVFKTFE